MILWICEDSLVGVLVHVATEVTVADEFGLEKVSFTFYATCFLCQTLRGRLLVSKENALAASFSVSCAPFHVIMVVIGVTGVGVLLTPFLHR